MLERRTGDNILRSNLKRKHRLERWTSVTVANTGLIFRTEGILWPYGQRKRTVEVTFHALGHWGHSGKPMISLAGRKWCVNAMDAALNAQITENRNSELAYIDPAMGQRPLISWVASHKGKTKKVAIFQIVGDNSSKVQSLRETSILFVETTGFKFFALNSCIYKQITTSYIHHTL